MGKVVPEGWAVIVTAQPSGTTLNMGLNWKYLMRFSNIVLEIKSMFKLNQTF